MNGLQVHYDVIGKTLTVWFDDPEKKFVAEKTGDEVVLIKDEADRVIDFKRLNYILEYGDGPRLELHTV